MKILLLLLFPLSLCAQRVVTLDPDKDPVARRLPDGSLQLMVPNRALVASIQETIPQMMDIQTVVLGKIGKSNYLMAQGDDRYRPGAHYSVAILLVETTPGLLQTDNLVISCSSDGNCRECTFPAPCTCTKGGGGCTQDSSMDTPLKKVTVTIFD